MNRRNAHIIASGSYAPKKIIPNSYFNELLGEDVDTWLKEKVQIYSRHWCDENESTADLVEQACKITLSKVDIAADDIDLLIVATDTPEYISPSTSVIVQYRLGMTKAGTFDINTACAGFVTALDTGVKYIQADEHYKNILVVGAYSMSKYLQEKDKKTITLFADGAAAVLLQSSADNNSGYKQSKLFSLGEYHDWMGIYGGASKYPMDENKLQKKMHQLHFVKKIPAELNTEIWSKMILEICEREKIAVHDVDHFFFTQININSIFDTMDKLGVNRQKAATIMHDYGYTGSACIPMAFDQWMEMNKIKKDEYVIFMGSGGGLAFGVSLFKM